MAQDICEEMMIAKPTPLIVKRRQKKIVALQFFQHHLAVRASCERIAKRCIQPFENGGLNKEALGAFRLSGEHFIGEIVQNKAMTSGECLDKTGQILTTAQGER